MAILTMVRGWASFALLGLALPATALPGLGKSQSYHPGDSSLSEVQVVSYGDSISSGFFRKQMYRKVSGGAFADRLGAMLRDDTRHPIKVLIEARAGARTSKILEKLGIERNRSLAQAQLVLMNGGGNEYLGIVHDKNSDLCEVARYRAAREENEIRASRCQNGKSPHPVFLNSLLETNYAICHLAFDHGHTCVDLFELLNCSEADSCRQYPRETLAEYKAKILRLDGQNRLHTPGANWMQSDLKHPNSEGHQRIAEEIRAAARL